MDIDSGDERDVVFDTRIPLAERREMDRLESIPRVIPYTSWHGWLQHGSAEIIPMSACDGLATRTEVMSWEQEHPGGGYSISFGDTVYIMVHQAAGAEAFAACQRVLALSEHIMSMHNITTTRVSCRWQHQCGLSLRDGSIDMFSEMRLISGRDQTWW
jgi:hypothetical protein